MFSIEMELFTHFDILEVFFRLWSHQIGLEVSKNDKLP